MASPPSAVSETHRSENEQRPHNIARISRELQRDLIHVTDDADLPYALPWELGREWASFVQFIKEIYRRKDSASRVKEIEEERFDAVLVVTELIILPSVWTSTIRPGDRVTISFQSDQAPPITRVRRRSSYSRYTSPDVIETGSDDDQPENLRVIDAEDDEDGVSFEESEESEESDSEPPPFPEPIRIVESPVDHEGNELTFTVNTGWGNHSQKPGKENGVHSDTSRKPTDRPAMNSENFKITRAMSVTSEGRTTIHIHALPGPESSTFSSSIHIRWHHLYADRLDWSQFKNTCLNIAVLSDRMQKLIAKLFWRLEKDKLEAYLGGMFIEPGTVLRADESDPIDPQSVIFSCVPYFDIRNTLKTASGGTDRLHPSRTLMQTYYPYEPVQDRDDEQAYRKFGNGRGGLVHVPSMWMMNIGSHAVVTCGYRPLTAEFVKSIELVTEDPKQLSLGFGENRLTTIRLTDWNQRVLIYDLEECRTYFELERKLRELNFSSKNPENSIQLLTNTRMGVKRVSPSIWPRLVSQRNIIFVDLFVTTKSKLKEVDQELSVNDISSSAAPASLHNSIAPFFNWPTTKSGENTPVVLKPLDADQSKDCLEQVEKAMIEEGLLKEHTIGAVDDTFTSSRYYDELSEVKYDDFLARLRSTLPTANVWERPLPGSSFHENFVRKHCSELAREMNDLIDVVCATLKLFVFDMDKSVLMRKLWAAMSDLTHTVRQMVEMQACPTDSREYLDPDFLLPVSRTRLWKIRTPKKHDDMAPSIPGGKDTFSTSVRKCRRCRHRQFEDPNAALEHLRSAHLGQGAVERDIIDRPVHPNARDVNELKDWICSEDQWVVESTVSGAVAILSYATKEARSICTLLQELADGVRDENGVLSSLYMFPTKLIGTFHQLLILYFAVERSLHFIQERSIASKNSRRLAGGGTNQALLDDNSEILRRFSEGVKTPLSQARENLCDMARSSSPKRIEERLSLGPEYVCSWLMRKLIVKPLDRSMSIADMYREYLSTIQFQVNHRPGKRLLRSIKLIQEEIMVLATITSWQARLVANYRKVLDDASYPASNSSRRAMFLFEKQLLSSSSESLGLTGKEFDDQYERCNPLSDSTKQSAEINEEDHGKAIFVFTVVTAIFLPLSFITSYLGMNTSDIRDMENNQTLFWEIAAPLTVAVVGSVLYIAYNGDELRDHLSSGYRFLTGKQTHNVSARGISIIQRKQATQASTSDTSSTIVDSAKSLADEAEYATPRPVWAENDIYNQTTTYATRSNARIYTDPLDPRMPPSLHLHAPHTAPKLSTSRNRRLETSFEPKLPAENLRSFGEYEYDSDDEWYRQTYAKPTVPSPRPPPPSAPYQPPSYERTSPLTQWKARRKEA